MAKNLVKLLPTVTGKADYVPNGFVAPEKEAEKQNVSDVCGFLVAASDKVS